MGRDSMLEDKAWRRQALLDPALESCQDDSAMDFTSVDTEPDAKFRVGSFVGYAMRKPRRAGSKGIRIYWHERSGKQWSRTRESHNYYTGMEVVRALMRDPHVKILAVGSSSGAMCLHYTLR